MTIKRNLGGFRLLSPLVFALLSAIPGKSTFAGSGTIDPGNFPPGQDVSNAAPGVVLSTMTLTATADPTFVAPSLSPVYSISGLFAPSTTSVDWGGPRFPDLQTSCLNGCSSPLAGETFLEIAFATPVSSVSVDEYQNLNNPTGFQAFDSAGNVIGTCVGYAVNGGQSSSCYAPTGTNSPVNGETGWTFTFSDPNDISYILATSYDGGSPAEIGEITYVPLPDNFWLLLTGLGGLGCYLLLRRKAIAT
jgi:hypothetical protein